MNTLRRTDKRSDGVFGEFSFEVDPNLPNLFAFFAYTLEHAYDDGQGGWQAKLPEGVYTCVRGTHALHNGIPFETFEITGVAGHKGILFHAGNFNRDSEGCVLLGRDVAINPNTGEEMVTGSKAEFAAFMARLDGVDSFQLEVV